MPVAPALRRLWYEHHMFKTSLNKTAKSCLNKQNNSRKKFHSLILELTNSKAALKKEKEKNEAEVSVY